MKVIIDTTKEKINTTLNRVLKCMRAGRVKFSDTCGMKK
jgi:hypothetical protein